MSFWRDLLIGNRKVFISFDYDNDKQYKFLLTAITKNPRFSLDFSDNSSREVNSNDIGRIKAALSRKIGESTHTLVLIGQYANSLHKDHKLIGYRNWINYEVAKSKEFGKKIVAVKLNPNFASPEELLRSGVTWVKSFNIDNITAAIDNC